MPSFDVVSQVDMQEVDNAVNGVVREIGQRFDFKGSDTSVERSEAEIVVVTDDDLKLKQVHDLIKTYFTRRNIDAQSLEFGAVESASGNKVRQKITVKQGIDREMAKKITKAIKDSKMKVQASVQGEEVRITGKKRDDLQEAIAHIKELPLDLPVQFINFRD